MTGSSDRRRGERHSVDVPGELTLAGGRKVAVRVVNEGGMGALCEMTDLEEPVAQGERALLDHAAITEEGTAGHGRVRRAGVIVRVELEFGVSAVTRQIAIFFDGGAPPA